MTTSTPSAPQERGGAAPRELAIIAGFVVLVGIAVATVLIPALRDDAGDDEDEQTQPTGAAGTTGGAAAPAVTDPGALPAPPTAPVGP